MLSKLENQLINFISDRKNCNPSEIGEIYLSIKQKFNINGKKYKILCSNFYELHRMIYRNNNETDIIDSIVFFEFLYLLRFISYSFSKRKISYYKEIAKKISNHIDKPLTIIDYGCGLGYLSRVTYSLKSNSKIFFIDIDSLFFDFLKYISKEDGINFESIEIDKNLIYPNLPNHNVCIAMEVIEHTIDPVKIIKNIAKSIDNGGVLYGNFKDHNKDYFHVSYNLKEIRLVLLKYFNIVEKNMYKRNGVLCI